MDIAALAEKIVHEYNDHNFDELAKLIAQNIDFAHFNRNFSLSSSTELIGLLREFSATYFQHRLYEPPERVLVVNAVVVREAWFAGTAAADLPGFAVAGESFRQKFCSIMRFGPNGLLVEWKDYG